MTLAPTTAHPKTLITPRSPGHIQWLDAYEIVQSEGQVYKLLFGESPAINNWICSVETALNWPQACPFDTGLLRAGE